MTGHLRQLAVAILAVGWVGSAPAPPAAADRPPAVEDKFLPPRAKPAPAEPTEHKVECTSATFDQQLNVGPTQLKSLDLPALWPLTTGKGQTVAVIDTGVSTHPRLPRLTPGGDYVSTGDGTEDCDAHGTLVAGIIGATPDAGIQPSFAGVAPDVSLIAIRQSSNKYGPIRYRDDFGVGDVKTLAMAVRTAADMGATVINISTVACVGARGLDDRALGAALKYAVDVKDVVVVTAAGNVGSIGQCPQQNPPPDPARPGVPDWDAVTVSVSPGWYDDYVLTVGSVTADGSPSTFSLAGPWVDVAAPGEAVLSLSPEHSGVANSSVADGDPTAITGTSYAAPVVSAIAALVRARFPQLSAREVMSRIEATAHHPADGWNPYVGSGAIDARAAISDDPPVPGPPTRNVASRPVVQPDPSPPRDFSGRTTAFKGVAGCAAVLAGVLALLAPANRLTRRRPIHSGCGPARPS